MKVPEERMTVLARYSIPSCVRDADNPPLFHDQRFRGALLDFQMLRPLQAMLHFQRIGSLIGLRSRGADGGAFRGIEHPELDAAPVCDLAHEAAQGVDLPDDMAFCRSPDGGVAAHFADRVEIHREQKRCSAHSGSCMRSFAASVARSYDQHIKFFWIFPHF